ncbi:hypothetical protein JHK87_037319 [Glycine soja]|nr:hypothetical protein JHK87_037319 [Glycine soja]
MFHKDTFSLNIKTWFSSLKKLIVALRFQLLTCRGLLSVESGSSELDKLHPACREWGFFQLINPGVSSSLVEKVKLEIQDFFNLPMSETYSLLSVESCSSKLTKLHLACKQWGFFQLINHGVSSSLVEKVK